MSISLRFLLAMSLVGAPGLASAAQPANPHASPQARAILNYFHSLEHRSKKHILSGQFSDFGNRASLRIMSAVHAKTGHWPAILGVDYADFPHGSLTFRVPNRTAIAYWRQGGLVTVSAHLYDPANPRGGGLRDKGVDLQSLLDPGTATHRRWMHELDLLAGGLKHLQNAGVVVLWRPFHEMNGGWFWWGAKDPATFIRVWRQMFDYFTNEKGLNNLLWVYAPNHGRNTAKYYPGAHYVDLVGLDAYTDDIDPQHIFGYAAVAALGKPFGFTEFGPHGPQHPPGNYDYRRFLAGIQHHFPATCFFMSWNGRWSLASNTHTRDFLDNPAIVNRGDLPAGLVGGKVKSSKPQAQAQLPSDTSAGWQKYAGNPVLGGSLGTCFDVAVLRIHGRYRMWFSWRPKHSIGLVESPDGIHWSQPIVALGPNPATDWEADINRPSVVHRADGYHLWYTGQAHGHSWIGYATSADGVHWKRVSRRPVLAPNAPWEKVAVMCPSVLWDPVKQEYRMWYSGGDQYEPDAIGYATSPDGRHWTKWPTNPIFTADPHHPWEQYKVTGGQVVLDGAWYDLFYIGFRDVNHAQIGVARSRDGVTGWQRLAANPIIRPGPGWDHDACYKPYAIFTGTRWLLWYNGRHGGVEQIGLALHDGADLGFN